MKPSSEDAMVGALNLIVEQFKSEKAARDIAERSLQLASSQLLTAQSDLAKLSDRHERTTEELKQEIAALRVQLRELGVDGDVLDVLMAERKAAQELRLRIGDVSSQLEECKIEAAGKRAAEVHLTAVLKELDAAKDREAGLRAALGEKGADLNVLDSLMAERQASQDLRMRLSKLHSQLERERESWRDKVATPRVEGERGAEPAPKGGQRMGNNPTYRNVLVSRESTVSDDGKIDTGDQQ